MKITRDERCTTVKMGDDDLFYTRIIDRDERVRWVIAIPATEYPVDDYREKELEKTFKKIT